VSRFSINATELSNTDVNFVALVKRGANRIPFRITKSEDNDMINLHSIGQRMFKSEEPQPVLVAAIVSKGADVAAISATLKSAGIDVTNFVKGDKDGFVTLTKADADTRDVVVVKMAGGVALAYTGLSKAFDGYDFQSPDFGEVHSKGTHMQSLSAAGDSLHRTVGNIMDTAPDPKTASQQIGNACDAHKAHCQAMTKKLPVQAFKADQALLKAEVAKLMKGPIPDMRKHPHAGLAMAIAHAAHQAALTAQSAGAMVSGGTDDDQQTGGGFGGQGDGGKGMQKAEGDTGVGDVAAADPEMPGKGGKTKKADAGQNGTGAGFAQGDGTSTDARATDDDASNTEIDAKPGARTSGSNSGISPMLQTPTQKSAIATARLAIAKAELAVLLAKDGLQDDEDNTNGAQDDVPGKLKAATAKTDIAGLKQPTGESQAGEGIEGALDIRDKVSDEDVTGSTVNTGKVKGATLETSGIPTKLLAPTSKNEADADIGKKGAGHTAADDISVAGAVETNVQQMKADMAAIMGAVKALSKATGDSITALTKEVSAVAVMAKKNDAALSGTVFNEAGDDNVRAMKSDRSGAPPLLDTGYSRRSA